MVGALYLAVVCLLPEYLISEFSLPFYFGGLIKRGTIVTALSARTLKGKSAKSALNATD